MIVTYRRINKPPGVDPTIATVQSGWPHGDAWGKVMLFPESHDTERHAELLKEREKRGKK